MGGYRAATYRGVESTPKGLPRKNITAGINQIKNTKSFFENLITWNAVKIKYNGLKAIIRLISLRGLDILVTRISAVFTIGSDEGATWYMNLLINENKENPGLTLWNRTLLSTNDNNSLFITQIINIFIAKNMSTTKDIFRAYFKVYLNLFFDKINMIITN